MSEGFYDHLSVIKAAVGLDGAVFCEVLRKKSFFCRP